MKQMHNLLKLLMLVSIFGVSSYMSYAEEPAPPFDDPKYTVSGDKGEFTAFYEAFLLESETTALTVWDNVNDMAITDFSMESENTNLVVVSGQSLVTNETLGTANVIISINGGDDSFTISVTVLNTQPRLEEFTIESIVGDTVLLGGYLSKTTLAKDLIYNVYSSTVEGWVDEKTGAFVAQEAGYSKVYAYENNTPVATWGIQTGYDSVYATDIITDVNGYSVKLGEAFTIEYGIAPEDADNKYVVFSSSDVDVATVDHNGIVTANGAGITTITLSIASDPSISTSIDVEVVEDSPMPTAITASPATLSIWPGESATITYSIEPANAQNSEVVFTSSNTSVATVDPYGEVYAVEGGDAIITITSADNPDISTEVPVVVVKEGWIEEITTPYSYITIPSGLSKTIAYSVVPADVPDNSVTFSIADEAVATVSEDGVVTGVNMGTTTLTITSNENETVTTSLTVYITEGVATPVELYAMEFEEPKGRTALQIGEFHRIDYYISPKEAGETPISFESSDPSIVTVDENGVALALTEGVVDITLTCTEHPSVFTVLSLTVTNEVALAEYLMPLVYSISLKTDEKKHLTYALWPAKVTDHRVIFKSSAPTIASVSQYGEVQGIKEGTATITAFWASDTSKQTTFDVTVDDTPSLPFELRCFVEAGDSIDVYSLFPENTLLDTIPNLTFSNEWMSMEGPIYRAPIHGYEVNTTPLYFDAYTEDDELYAKWYILAGSKYLTLFETIEATNIIDLSHYGSMAYYLYDTEVFTEISPGVFKGENYDTATFRISMLDKGDKIITVYEKESELPYSFEDFIFEGDTIDLFTYFPENTDLGLIPDLYYHVASTADYELIEDENRFVSGSNGISMMVEEVKVFGYTPDSALYATWQFQVQATNTTRYETIEADSIIDLTHYGPRTFFTYDREIFTEISHGVFFGQNYGTATFHISILDTGDAIVTVNEKGEYVTYAAFGNVENTLYLKNILPQHIQSKELRYECTDISLSAWVDSTTGAFNAIRGGIYYVNVYEGETLLSKIVVDMFEHIDVVEVLLTYDTVYINLYEQYQPPYTVIPSNATTSSFYFEAVDTTIVGTTPDRLYGLSLGETSVVLRDWKNQNIEAYLTVYVVEDSLAPLEIVPNETEITMLIGESVEALYKTIPTNALYDVIYTIDNASIATVSDGIVTGLAEGEATLTITSISNPEATAEITITVLENEPFTLNVEDPYVIDLRDDFAYTPGITWNYNPDELIMFKDGVFFPRDPLAEHIIKAEMPNDAMYTFNASIKLYGDSPRDYVEEYTTTDSLLNVTSFFDNPHFGAIVYDENIFHQVDSMIYAVESEYSALVLLDVERVVLLNVTKVKDTVIIDPPFVDVIVFEGKRTKAEQYLPINTPVYYEVANPEIARVTRRGDILGLSVGVTEVLVFTESTRQLVGVITVTVIHRGLYDPIDPDVDVVTPEIVEVAIDGTRIIKITLTVELEDVEDLEEYIYVKVKYKPPYKSDIIETKIVLVSKAELESPNTLILEMEEDIANAEDIELVFLEGGVQAKGGEALASNVLPFAIRTDISEEDAIVTVSPNPATDIVTVEGAQAVDIVSMSGNTLVSIIDMAPTSQINISNLPAGVYMLQLKTENGTQFIQLIKQ